MLSEEVLEGLDMVVAKSAARDRERKSIPAEFDPPGLGGGVSECHGMPGMAGRNPPGVFNDPPPQVGPTQRMESLGWIQTSRCEQGLSVFVH